MVDILLRNVRPETMAYLKERAARHGLSVSDEVKAFLIEGAVRMGYVASPTDKELLRRAERRFGG